MSSTTKRVALKTEKTRKEEKLERKKEHKCATCAFGSWTGLKYYCPFGKCAKESLRR